MLPSRNWWNYISWPGSFFTPSLRRLDSQPGFTYNIAAGGNNELALCSGIRCHLRSGIWLYNNELGLRCGIRGHLHSGIRLYFLFYQKEKEIPLTFIVPGQGKKTTPTNIREVFRTDTFFS